MRIGVPKERKRDERCVVLPPGQILIFTKEGHGIFMEAKAGEKCDA